MRLIHRSPCTANAARIALPGAELFVASLVICMVLSSFGYAVDPIWFGEAGLEFAFVDLGGEISVLAMRHWHLLELLLAGGMMAAVIVILRILAGGYFRPLATADPGAVEKVPIKL